MIVTFFLLILPFLAKFLVFIHYLQIPITTPTTWRTPATALQMVLSKEIEVLQHLNGVYTRAQGLNDYHVRPSPTYFLQPLVVFEFYRVVSYFYRLDSRPLGSLRTRTINSYLQTAVPNRPSGGQE